MTPEEHATAVAVNHLTAEEFALATARSAMQIASANAYQRTGPTERWQELVEIERRLTRLFAQAQQEVLDLLDPTVVRS